MKPFDFMTEAEIQAVEVLMGAGFDVIESARVGFGSRRRAFRSSRRYDLVLACRHIDRRDPVEPGEDSEPHLEPAPMEDPDPGKPLTGLRDDGSTIFQNHAAQIADMSRQELIDAVRDIPGAPNPTQTKTDTLQEILYRFRTGTYDPDGEA